MNPVTSWAPARWMATVMEGDAREAAPRASWKMIAEALAGREAARWAEVRSVRFDGPSATDANLERLAAAGCLDRVEALHLASDQLSARGLAIALSLPALATLSLEGVAVPELAPCESTVRRLELFACDPSTCAALVSAIASLSEIDLESVDPRRDHGIAWRAIAARDLRFLRLAHVPLAGAALEAMLARSTDLESLLLDDVPGLDSDAFLAGRTWAALRMLRWHRGTIAALGAHLPAELAELSLRGTSVAALHVGPWASNLTSLDCVGSSISDAMATHVDQTKLVHLGVASSDVALRMVAAMAESGLRSLELGDAFVRATGAVPLVRSLPAALESLVIDHAWALDDELSRDVLRGERAPRLRELRLEYVDIGNLDLDGGFSRNLQRLAIRYTGRAIEGLRQDHALALTHLALDAVAVDSDELVALLHRCAQLTSLCLTNVACFGALGLRDALVHVGAQLVQLSLAGFSADDIPANGDALVAARYPALAELHLDETTYSPRAFAHLLAADVTPMLERLSLDCAPGDEQWLSVVARPPSSLHWLEGQYTGEVEALHELLRDPASGGADAVLHLRRQPR